MADHNKNSIENILKSSLYTKVYAVREFPKLLPDHNALNILKQMGCRPFTPLSRLYRYRAGEAACRQYGIALEIKRYLERHEKALIIDMGAGLSGLRKVMKNADNIWINVDCPEVIELRNVYIPPLGGEINVACDLRDHRWFDLVPHSPEKGAVFIAQDVFAHMGYEEVRTLIHALGERFPGSLLIFDYHSRAKDRFCIKDGLRELMSLSPSVTEAKIRDYMEQYYEARGVFEKMTAFVKQGSHMIAVLKFKM